MGFLREAGGTATEGPLSEARLSEGSYYLWWVEQARRHEHVRRQRLKELDIEIVHHWYPDGTTQCNALAEIPGTDKRNDVIILGAHFDSCHAATGATDIAIGAATMMEAARIIQASSQRC